jgi:hypothetical protein
VSWGKRDWERLATLFDGVNCACAPGAAHGCEPYPGYKPETVEAPNGDTRECDACHGRFVPEDYSGGYRWHDMRVGPCACGATHVCGQCSGSGRVPNVDAAGICRICKGDREALAISPCPACDSTGRAPGKRYLHVAEKYLRQCPGLEWPREYLDRAYGVAARVAEALNVPAAYWPRPEHGALRVLDYPPGAGTVEHTDFDLFTVLLWRSTPGDLELTPSHRVCPADNPFLCDSCGAAAPFSSPCEAEIAMSRGVRAARSSAGELSPGLHIGELGELVGLGPATPHRVPARPYAQQSIVYFALPDHAAPLPGHAGVAVQGAPVRLGPTVGQWLDERMARSRVAAGGYK